MIVYSVVSLLLVIALVKLFHKLWWRPTRIGYLMGLQGIRGPSYKFIHGNTKEMASMKEEAMSKPMGLTNAIFSHVQPHIHSWMKIYGNIYLQWLGPEAQLVITEPELIKEVLNNKDKTYPKVEPQAFFKKLFGDGIVTNEGQKWAKLRKVANYAFHGESLKGMGSEMITSVEVMLERWKCYEGKEIEVFEEFRLLTSEVISRTAFGSSYLEGKYIFEKLMRLGLLVSRNVFKVTYPVISKVLKSSDEIESEKIEEEIHSRIIKIIRKREEKVAMIGQEDKYGSDYLGLLLKAHHDANDNQRISIDDLIVDCKTFYFAGQETTNSLLAWTVYLLSIHTNWQEEVRKEVFNLFGPQNPNPDGIAKLKTMSMIINESLRLYPPVIGLIRKTGTEVRLGNLTLPAKQNISMPILALHYDPKIWGEDVLHFKPERFSDGVTKAVKNNTTTAFLPFGLGPRNCVGSNFAIYETKIVLTMILQRYSFTLSPAYVHSPFEFLTLRPQHGLQIMLQPLVT